MNSSFLIYKNHLIIVEKIFFSFLNIQDLVIIETALTVGVTKF